MRTRVDLEPGVELNAAALQEIRDAARVGNGKTGIVFLNIHRNTVAPTFDILTASDANNPDLSSSSFWGSAGSTTVGSGQTGLVRFEIGVSSTTRLGELIRWKVTGLTAPLHFSIVVFLADA
jgi:predicted porin